MDDDAVAGAAGPENVDSAAQRGGPGGPLLPYAKSFMVQFTAETDARLEHVAGRVEHLHTGRRARFASVVELLECIVTLLAELNGPTKSGGSTARRAGRGRTKIRRGSRGKPAR